jgi:hypothetical protein
MDSQAFTELMAQVTRRIAGTPLDADLESQLNAWYPPDSGFVRQVRNACANGIADGWMCNREHAGIKYGRVVKPGPETHGFSVDVVEMRDIAGGHHRHPNGEIDLVLPIDDSAKFDGHGAGWVVYGPDSAHEPTVTGGKALVLYLLPQGAIQFSSGSSSKSSKS